MPQRKPRTFEEENDELRLRLEEAEQTLAQNGCQFTDVDPSKRQQLESLVKRLQRDLGS